MEAQPPVEAFRSMLARVIGHSQPGLPASPDFLAQFLDREPAVALALMLGADVEPPQVAVKQRVLMLGSERRHDEARYLVTVADEPGPGDIGHCVGVGERPRDRSDEVVLIGPQPQFACSPDIFLSHRFQAQARPHMPTLLPWIALGIIAPVTEGRPVRYQSAEEDSGRWTGFPFRPGDIVISTRSKTGTTWVQMICALLVFQTPDLPTPLGQLSPWLDHLIEPRDTVLARLEAQQHRRFIKTHTPLDGIPLDPRATYIVTARHPLDMYVSLYHQGNNIDRAKVRQLTGQAEPDQPVPPRPPRRPLHEAFLRWIDRDTDPRDDMDGLPGVIRHVSGAWARREQLNVVLVHYDELSADLDGQMRRLADRLGIAVPEQTWPALVQAATFDSMRTRASQLLPSSGILKSEAAFFRRGTSGEGREILTADEVEHYHRRVAQLGPAGLLAWLHSPGDNRPAFPS
jgi:aryl sulfotransferase